MGFLLKKIIVQSILSPYKEYRIKPIKPLLCLPYIRPLSLTCVDNWILFTITLSVFYAYQLFSSFLLNKYLQSSNQILSCPLNFREGVLQCIWYHLCYSSLLIIFWYKEDTFYNKHNGGISWVVFPCLSGWLGGLQRETTKQYSFIVLVVKWILF